MDILNDILNMNISEYELPIVATIHEEDIVNRPSIVRVDYETCPECGITGKIYRSTIICEQCGLTRDWQTYEDVNYNETIHKNYTFGNPTHGFGLSYTDYSTYRYNSIKRSFMNKVHGTTIPMESVYVAIDLFAKIKDKKYIIDEHDESPYHDGVSANCLEGPCLYYACIMERSSRPVKEIVNIMQMKNRAFSKGLRIMRELNDLGIIEIPVNISPIHDYITNYLTALKISLDYRDFLVHLINRADDKGLHMVQDSLTTTKCLGAIYLLVVFEQKKMPIKASDIPSVCKDVTLATITRYSKLLCRYPRLIKKSFRKYHVRMPKTWAKY
jgi:transcription initiation factor TFIIIB Brf1 subunit/transcription initiation factor TFIIB